MNDPIQDLDTLRASSIKFVDATNGKRLPHQLLLRQRIQKSLTLIKAGKFPMTEIALESGFHDQPHFIRVFRRLVGTTPARDSLRT